MADEEDDKELSEAQSGIVGHCLREIRNGTPVSKIAIPTHFIEPRSILEKFADAFTPYAYLLRAQQTEDPVQRLLEVGRWFLIGYATTKTSGVKKPFNPLLGEYFASTVRHEGSELNYFAEQVSHHPPITAVYAEDRPNHIMFEGSVHTKCTYWVTGTVGSLMLGTFRLHFTDRAESYEITMPNVLCKGLLVGKLRTELSGDVHIRCTSSGLQLKLKFKEKPMFGGKMNGLEGKVLRRGSKDPIYTLKGRWDSEVLIREPNSEQSEVFFNVNRVELCKLVTRPIWEQREYESQRVWFDCVEAINEGDHKESNEHKLRLENAQRNRKLERDQGTRGAHVPRFFELDTSTAGWIYRQINRSADAEATLNSSGPICPPDGLDPWEEMGNGEQDAGAAAETEETGAAAEEQQQWDCDDDDESSQISQTEFHDCTNEFVGVAMWGDRTEVISRCSSKNTLHNVSALPHSELELFFTPRNSQCGPRGDQLQEDLVLNDSMAVDQARMHYHRAQSLCKENEMEAAFAQFRESVKLTPSHASWVALTGETSFMAEPK